MGYCGSWGSRNMKRTEVLETRAPHHLSDGRRCFRKQRLRRSLSTDLVLNGLEGVREVAGRPCSDSDCNFAHTLKLLS